MRKYSSDSIKLSERLSCLLVCRPLRCVVRTSMDRRILSVDSRASLQQCGRMDRPVGRSVGAPVCGSTPYQSRQHLAADLVYRTMLTRCTVLVSTVLSPRRTATDINDAVPMTRPCKATIQIMRQHMSQLTGGSDVFRWM